MNNDIGQKVNNIDESFNPINETPWKKSIEFHKSYSEKPNRTLLKLLTKPGYASERVYAITSMIPEKEEYKDHRNSLLAIGYTFEIGKAVFYGSLLYKALDKFF